MLRKATRVVFTVNQVSPVCLGIGHFTVAGHAGLNRVKFAGRVHGRPLEPGTYRISARTADGRLVRRIRLVVVDGPAPSRAELRSLQAANVCTAATTSTASFASSSGNEPAASEPRLIAQGPDGSSGVANRGPDVPAGVLGSAIEETARAIQPVLVALLALAILLLAVASLPALAVPDRRINDMLVRHRGEIAGLGATVLIAVALTFLVG